MSTVERATFDYAAQPKVNHVACNCCGWTPTGWMPVSKTDRYGFSARLVECFQCGLQFIDPQMTAAGYEIFYRKWYRQLIEMKTGQEQTIEFLESHQKIYATMMTQQLLPTIPMGGDYLDIGGSTGVVAKAIADTFKTDSTTVLDPAENELNEAEARGLATVHSTAEGWRTAPEVYSLITMFQTVEHLLNPAVVFAEIRKGIKDDGLFIFDTVPPQHKIDHPFNIGRRPMLKYMERARFAVKLEKQLGRHKLWVCKPK